MHCKETAGVDHAVLLCTHRCTVGQREHLVGDIAHGHILISRLAHLDEHGILCESACIEEERDLVGITHSAHGLDVGHGDGLSAP